MKTVFILGAGASVEAGLPSSTGLLKSVREYGQQCDGLFTPIRIAIEWADRQMMRQVTNVQDANIELLFNILAVAGAQPRLPESAVFRSMHRPARRAHRQYQQTISRPEPNPFAVGSEPNVFMEVASQLREGLASWLTIQNPEAAAYIVPLLEYCVRTESIIISLNYDNVIESASQLSGIPVTDGVGSWTECRKLVFTDGAIPLIKLHGSLNWFEKDERLDGGKKRRPTIVREQFSRSPGRQRVLIFGGQNKLTYLPPFPDLYAEFRKVILGVDAVSVIGYSGSDPHVNQVLFDWAFTNDERVYSEATFYGEVYSQIFGVGPFHRHDVANEFVSRPGGLTRANRTLKLKIHEWPKRQKPHTATYLQNLDRLFKD